MSEHNDKDAEGTFSSNLSEQHDQDAIKQCDQLDWHEIKALCSQLYT